MCGIAGFIDFNQKLDRSALTRMTDVLHHRGPDDSGYSFYHTADATIGLGHRRLSILDLSSHGHQPMAYQNLEIIYNGEVYNFKEIRKELETYDYKFESDSDTEVILKAYHKWGIKAVDQFNGMFAIAIYDKKANKLVLIRDRSGVKPLFYYHKNGNFLFTSELKSFHEVDCFDKQIDQNALALYLQYGYVPQPYTIFQDTHKLEAGYYLEVDIEKKHIQEIKYWDVIDQYNKPKLIISDEEAIEETEKLLKSAFEYRMVSDVPVGMFLSGGYDSSIVTAMLQHERTEKINTFTIGFHEKGFNEAPYAKKVAQLLGTNHTEYYCTQKDALEIIPKLPDIFDEPFGDSSGIPTTLVSALARKDVTVSLSADGGDEIFAGYSKYQKVLRLYSLFSKVPRPVKSISGAGMNMINPSLIPFLNSKFESRYWLLKNILASESPTELMKYNRQFFTFSQVKNLLKSPIIEKTTHFDDPVLECNDQLNHMLAVDYKTYMVDDILTKVDRAGMSVSLEGREPLLDYRLIEFVAQLPSHLKFRDGQKKWILKEITHKYLPKELMDRPKMGFGVPITEWFRDELKEYFMEYMDANRLEEEGLFNVEAIIRIRDKYLNGSVEGAEKPWRILMFQMWYERWMK